MPYLILAAVLVAADQLVKYLVAQNVMPWDHVPLIPGIIEITYVENTGAAFSLFAGDHTWALALVSLVLSIIILVALLKNFFRHPLGKVTLSLLLAGAFGNFIDRAFRGYVVDMFNVLFMRFAVFNVADICVVVGGIAAAVYYLFLAPKLEPGLESAVKTEKNKVEAEGQRPEKDGTLETDSEQDKLPEKPDVAEEQPDDTPDTDR